MQQAVDNGGRTVRVIVTVRGPRDAVRGALRAHGDRLIADLPRVGSFAAELHAADVDVLASDPSVTSITADATVTAGSSKFDKRRGSPSASGIISDTLRQTLGLPATVNVHNPNTPNTGDGITVALIDSGIQPNPDVPANRIIAFCDFTKPTANGNPTCGSGAASYDDFGHGTHVAGLIGASGAASHDAFQGVAPKVNFVVLKVLDGTGQGSTSDVIAALQMVLQNPAWHVRVVNLSLGHPIFAKAADDPLVQAVEDISAAGTPVVVSAGNFGQKLQGGGVGFAGITSPGNAPSAITVGATDTKDTITRGDDRLALFSSRGPTWYDGFAKPDVVAPGTNLISDTNKSGFLYRNLKDSRTTSGSNTFLTLSGTSMSTGVTTGVVSLILEANDRASDDESRAPLTSNAVKAILEYTAIRLPGGKSFQSVNGPLGQGTGEINAGGAIQLAESIDTSVQPGSNWIVRPVLPITVLMDGHKRLPYVWGQNIIWGDNIVWGDLLKFKLDVWTNNIVWGDNIVWGNGFTIDNIVWGEIAQGDNIVWGNLDHDNIVWGNLDLDNIVWGNLNLDNIVWGNFLNDNIVWGNNIVWGF